MANKIYDQYRMRAGACLAVNLRVVEFSLDDAQMLDAPDRLPLGATRELVRGVSIGVKDTRDSSNAHFNTLF